MVLLLNEQVIDTVYINQSNYQIGQINNYSRSVNLSAGVNSLKFAMRGAADGMGIYLDNVNLQEVIQNSTTTGTFDENVGLLMEGSLLLLRSMVNNSFNSILNQLPGSRIVLGYLMGFNIEIDRLQFYYYHKQNLTEYATIFLEAIYIFKQQQGSMI
jgi:hypothetical protein